MSYPLRQKKPEGWLGLVLTAVICGGVLFWWFRPARETWQPHTTEQLVARALAEPGLDQPSHRLVIDFDLMETAILQARLDMVPEGLNTAARMVNPIVQARTIRTLSQVQLSSDAKNLGDALTMCDRIGDLELRAKMRQEIVLQIASLGFADVVLPEAKTLLSRVQIARCLAESDGQENARKIVAEAEAALPGLPGPEARAVAEELAWTRVNLANADGPQQAFDAIRRLDPETQDELWLELFRYCFGRGDNSQAEIALVAGQVSSPQLRQKMDLEAIQSNAPLRTPEEFLAGLQKELEAATPGPAQIRCLLNLAVAHQIISGMQYMRIPLDSALNSARELKDPVQRAAYLAEISQVFSDSALFEESKAILTEAVSTANTVQAPDQRLPLVIRMLRDIIKSGEMPTAAHLAMEALPMAAKVKLPRDQMLEYAELLTKLGDWQAALTLLENEYLDPPVPRADGPAPAMGLTREGLLDAIAATAAEDNIGYDASAPPPRGEPLDRIRERVLTDEAAAAAYLPAVPAGFERARATLALAKGLLSPPPPADPGLLPEDPTGPMDLLPGQDPPVPMLPEEQESR